MELASGNAQAARTRGEKISRWSTILGLFMFVIGCFIGSFVFSLMAWFIFWVALFHWVLCCFDTITRTHVRLIDYPYLIAAFVAIFLAAASSQQNRDAVLKEIDDISAPPTRSGLREHVDADNDRFCKIPNEALRPPEFCGWILRLEEFLAGDKYALADLQNLADESVKLANQKGWGEKPDLILPRRTTPNGDFITYPEEMEKSIAINNTLFYAGQAGVVTIRSMKKVIARELPPPVQSVEPGLPNAGAVSIRAIIALIWPFLFALALALRLTKTTAEVTDWARPDAPRKAEADEPIGLPTR